MRCFLDGGERAIRRKILVVKGGGIQRSVSDYCRLRCCPLKTKFAGETQTFSRPLRIKSAQNGTLSEIWNWPEVCHVCHACARKIRNAFDDFIISRLQKEKPETAIEVSDDSSTCKLVHCQWPFRRQIEVLKQEKDIKHQTTVPLL